MLSCICFALEVAHWQDLQLQYFGVSREDEVLRLKT